MSRNASQKDLQELKDSLQGSSTSKRSLFLNLDDIEEWEKSFHFVPKEVRDLVLQRNEYRLQRLFEKADALKSEIWARGWGCRDMEGSVHVYRRRYWSEPIK